MGTFYRNSSAQIDVLSTPYIQDRKFTSFSESPIIQGNMMMYLSGASSAGSFSEIAPGSSMSTHNYVEIPSMTGRNEVMFIPPNGDQMSMQTINGQLNTTASDPMRHPVNQLSIVDGERNFHGLSLSLSTQLSTAVPPSSFQQFSNSGLSPVLSSHLPLSGEEDCRPMANKAEEAFQSKDLRNSTYGSYDLHGAGQDSVRFGAPTNLHYLANPKAVGYNAYQYEQAGIASTILKSKYLEVARELLDEVVNVRDAMKKHESGKEQNMNKVEDGNIEAKEKSEPASDTNESTAAPSQELSATECQDLQNKLDKLLAMSEEVDRRYKQYYHQMQILFSFDLVAGCGASKPYTTLAQKTISRHFRSLRDAISAQIQATRKSLGEQASGQGGIIPRLRYVDQQLRQQRALQQFGMMRHAWRSQRGLPESAVTTLRAWLFEHFLHPYPKDSEKIMLARQTGLTRSQVANWFINARVRLWKPMVEEMYKEEFGDEDLNFRSSSENLAKAAGEKSCTSKDRREELQESIRSMADNGHPRSSHDESKTNVNQTNTEMSQSTGKAGIMKLHDNQHSLNSHEFYPHDQNGLMAFQVPEPTSYGSLALGLRRIDGNVEHLSAGASTDNAVGPGTAEYSYFGPANQQHKFGNSHLLNDFVV